MKKIMPILLIVLIVSLIPLVTAAPAPNVVWVDFDGSDNGYDRFNTIQEGITAIESGGTVYIAAGTYPESVSINKDATIIGDGADLVTVTSSGTSTFYLDALATNVSISGCTIKDGPHNVLGMWGGSSQVTFTISDCVVQSSTNTPVSGVHLEALEGAQLDVTINNCEIHSNDGAGIYLRYRSSSSGTFLIDGNEIHDNNTGVSLIIDTLSEAGVSGIVDNNKIEDNHSACTGISVRQAYDSALDLTIRNNEIKDSSGSGISITYVDGLPSSSSTLLTHNTIETNHNGIYVSLVPSSPSSTLGNGGTGEHFLVITENTISKNNQNGIMFSDHFSHLVFKIGQDNGIDSYGVLISKNRITNNTYSGIVIDGSRDWAILNNLIAWNGRDGIRVNVMYHYNSLIANNTIYQNGEDGIGGSIPTSGQLGNEQWILLPGFPANLYNNIIVDNGIFGIEWGLGGSSLLGEGGFMMPYCNNNVWGNDVQNYSIPMFDLTGLCGNISQDPQFVSSTDLHLTRESPCVDAGGDAILVYLNDDLDGTMRPMGQHVDMGCYELVWSSFSPETFHPLVITQLANANATWTCIMEHLPDDPELMEEVEPLLEDVQAHMGNATSISNYIQANGELRKALSIMAEIDAMCECGCFE